MSNKSKFQISKSLDERIKKLTNCPEECEASLCDIEQAFVLGFSYSNVTNYVGLTTDFRRHNATCSVVGLSYFKSCPTDQMIKSHLQPAVEYFHSYTTGIGSEVNVDKNEHLFIIYYKDTESNLATKKIFDLKAGTFLNDQPKLSVLDDGKIYNHSAIVKLDTSLRLNICDENNNLLSAEKINSAIDDIKSNFETNSKNITLHLSNSNFSTKNPLENKSPLEFLYGQLDIPNDSEQMSDYLPQLSKEEKKKLHDKWRNKVKDQRAPLDIQLGLNEQSVSQADTIHYNLTMCEFIYLHVNDSIAKCTRIILFHLRQKLELMKELLMKNAGKQLSVGEIRSCTFKPSLVNHFVPAVYLIPHETATNVVNYEQLKASRLQLHLAYLLAQDKPTVRYSQRVQDANMRNLDEMNGFLCNVHCEILDKSDLKGGLKSVIAGTYTYHHYLQDKIQDNGWGCAYRSLQTIISWFKHQAYICSPDVELRAPRKNVVGVDDKISSLRLKLNKEMRVPNHEEIQSVLVDVGDKQASFIGSQKWIGSQEVCYVLNHLYDLDSKFISVSSGGELVSKARDLSAHFSTNSTPVMIGGGVLAHTIIGIDFNEKNGDTRYLVLDPHYTGGEDLQTITKKGWCDWKKNSFWDKGAFYNLCLPQRPVEF